MLFPSRNNWYNWYNRYNLNRRGRRTRRGEGILLPNCLRIYNINFEFAESALNFAEPALDFATRLASLYSGKHDDRSFHFSII